MVVPFRPLFRSLHADVSPFFLRIVIFLLIPSHLSALLFVGTRLSLDFNYTYSDCVKWYIFQEIGTQVLIATVESILIVRGVLSRWSLCRYAYCFISSTCPV
jgi:hypothetical protein